MKNKNIFSEFQNHFPPHFWRSECFRLGIGIYPKTFYLKIIPPEFKQSALLHKIVNRISHTNVFKIEKFTHRLIHTYTLQSNKTFKKLQFGQGDFQCKRPKIKRKFN